jgi:hypothetical protein
MTLIVGALAGVALVGCNDNKNARMAMGNPEHTARPSTRAQTSPAANRSPGMAPQTVEVMGKISHVDARSFTVEVPGGNEVTLRKSAQAGLNFDIQKGQDVRASYQVDAAGHKIARSLKVLPPQEPGADVSAAPAERE